MYNFFNLEKSSAIEFRQLTYPRYHECLNLLDNGDKFIATGVTYQDIPVAMSLSEYSQEDRSGQILSLFVVPEHRKNGLGRALLAQTEVGLTELGCQQVSLNYIANDTTPGLEKMLAQRQWPAPQPSMLVGHATGMNLQDRKWSNLLIYLQKITELLPSDCSIFKWSELSAREIAEIVKNKDMLGCPDLLSPSNDLPEPIEYLNSLGLRYQNRVVGWVITHRVSPATIRYTNTFICKDLQKQGYIMPVSAQAIALQLQDGTATNASFTVINDSDEYQPMLDLVEKRLAPYLSSIRQSWQSTKVLG